MTKEAIIQTMWSNHQEFIDLLYSLNEKDFMFAENNKWTAGQQLQHIILSVSPLAKGLLLPAPILKLIFGKANRPSKSFAELVARYHEKLDMGGVATGNFIPKKVAFGQRDKLNRKLLRTVNRLCNRIEKFSEKQLDLLILPHPLLGKVTLREMLYFTIYHVQHHKNLISHSLSNRKPVRIVEN